MPDENEFRRELAQVINRHSRENASGTPDFALAEFLAGCLQAWEAGIKLRETFFDREPNALGMAGGARPVMAVGLVDEDDLPDELCRRVRAWIVRAAPRVRHDADYATINITLLNPQGSDDNVSLYLDARIEEDMTTDNIGGRVPGCKFR